MDLDTYLTREGHGSVTRLAKRCDVSWSTINDIRRNGAEPSLTLALAISDATGGEVTLDDLRRRPAGEPPTTGDAA